MEYILYFVLVRLCNYTAVLTFVFFPSAISRVFFPFSLPFLLSLSLTVVIHCLRYSRLCIRRGVPKRPTLCCQGHCISPPISLALLTYWVGHRMTFPALWVGLCHGGWCAGDIIVIYNTFIGLLFLVPTTVGLLAISDCIFSSCLGWSRWLPRRDTIIFAPKGFHFIPDLILYFEFTH